MSLLRWQDKQADPALAAAPGERGLAHDPTLGWRVRPGHTAPGVTVDAAGHRVTPTAADGAPTVVLLGDSFTYGDEVADADTFAVRLATATGWHVVNAGVPGYGLDQCVLALERDVLPTRPDVVVLGLTSPMMVRPLATWDVWAKPWFTLQDGVLALHGAPLPPPGPEGPRLHRWRTLDLLEVWAETLRSPLRDDDARDALAAALLARAGRDADTAAVPLVVAWLPEVDLLGTPHGSGVDAPFAAWCAPRPTDCVAPWAAFEQAAAAGVALRQGAHWSPAGHQIVADALAPAVSVHLRR
ncbi:MAG: SGNH/GDSL hydrolase family protein [Alphaproteobacteria bacterium]|nr:SGNH/GDSL hydrolase family protein [Alphaproteobacteria bacterium]